MRLAIALLVLAACKGQGAARCAHCGMKMDPAGPFAAEIVDGATKHFDTPRCALSTWVESGKHGTVRVQDYYDRVLRPADDVRFVIGSDVVGPMGAELVPLDPARVAKFEKDHGGTRALTLAEIDAQALVP